MKADPPTSDLPLLRDLPFGIYAGSPPAAEGGVASVNERGVKDDGVIAARSGLSVMGGTPPIDVEDIMMEPYAPLCRAIFPSDETITEAVEHLVRFCISRTALGVTHVSFPVASEQIVPANKVRPRNTPLPITRIRTPLILPTQYSTGR